MGVVNTIRISSASWISGIDTPLQIIDYRIISIVFLLIQSYGDTGRKRRKKTSHLNKQKRPQGVFWGRFSVVRGMRNLSIVFNLLNISVLRIVVSGWRDIWYVNTW